MKYQIITIYIALISCLGIYGVLFAPFHPKSHVEYFSMCFSIVFFIFGTVVTVWLSMNNKIKLISKFQRPFNFYVFTFTGVPILLAFAALLHYFAWSKGIPSAYTFFTTQPETINSEIINKRLWGKNDRHEEIFISGYHEGFPVSKSYYHSVNTGQTIKIAVRKSSLGTYLEFLQP